MKKHSLFPSLVYQNNLKFKGISVQRKNSELVEEILKIREIDEAGQKWSKKNYVGGYTSYASVNQLHKFSTSFEEIEKLIDKEVQIFAKMLDMNLGNGKLRLTHLWANVMKPTVTHSMHIHPLSVISGTYYVKTPQDCSSIKFEDPRMVYFMASPPRKERAHLDNQRFFSIEPMAGQVVLFESWMRHEVPPNKAKQERISLSFNYEWV